MSGWEHPDPACCFMIGSSRQPNVQLHLPSTCLLEPKCACSCFQSTVDIKRLVNLSSCSSSSAGSGHGQGQPQPPSHVLPEKNGFAVRIHHLPDLIQQSHHSPSSSTTIPSSSSTTSSSSSSFPSSSSNASPAMSPQNPLDKLTAIEVCHPNITETTKERMAAGEQAWTCRK